jgi:hypothetical protein
MKEAGMADDEEIGSSATELKFKFKKMYDIIQELEEGKTECAIKYVQLIFSPYSRRFRF